jgi:uncharacterized OB-fold protein
VAYEKPRPNEGLVSEPYWEAAKQHRLMAQKCQQCGGLWAPPTAVCEGCLSPDLDWIELSGKGKVWSYIIMHQLYYPAFADDIPYNIAVIRSDEGPKFVTNLVGVKNEDIKVEMPVEVVFDDVDEDLTLPKWRPAS